MGEMKELLKEGEHKSFELKATYRERKRAKIEKPIFHCMYFCNLMADNFSTFIKGN